MLKAPDFAAGKADRRDRMFPNRAQSAISTGGPLLGSANQPGSCKNPVSSVFQAERTGIAEPVVKKVPARILSRARCTRFQARAARATSSSGQRSSMPVSSGDREKVREPGVAWKGSNLARVRRRAGVDVHRMLGAWRLLRLLASDPAAGQPSRRRRRELQ